MRILFITTYFEPDSGAAAVRLSRLAKLLGARGHEVTVLTAMPHYPQGRIAAGYRRKLFHEETRGGLRIVRAWLWAAPDARIIRRLASQVSLMFMLLLRGLWLPRPDVIFVEGQPVFTALAGWLISRLKRRPYVVNVSDFWPEHLVSSGTLRESHPLYRLFRGLVNHTQRRAAAIVALHAPLQASVQQRLGQNAPITVIYNAVDLDRFRPSLDVSTFRQKFDLRGERVIAFIGTFATAYDFATMLNVTRRFADNDDVRFIFAGGGNQQTYFEQWLEQHEPPNVRWLGWLDHAELPFMWAASHIAFWALHSHDLYQGTLPAKLYEAFASGVPVVAAMQGVGADLVSKSGAGLAVSPGDEAGLAAAIQRLLNDADLHVQCSQAARAYAEQHFDPERVAAAYEDVLKQAVES